MREFYLKSTVVLTSTSQLKQWAAALSVQRGSVRLRLDVPALAEQERATWEKRLERSHNDCGCTAAAVAFLASILLIAGYAIFVGFEQPIWLIVIVSVLVAIVALFVGKWFGHLRSRMQLRDHAAQLIHLIEQRTADESRT